MKYSERPQSKVIIFLLPVVTKKTFFLSLNYFDQEGVVQNTGIKKYIGRINVERTNLRLKHQNGIKSK